MLFEICQIFVFTTQVLMPALTLLDSTPSKAQLCTKNLHLSWVPIVACFLNVFYHKATVLIELHASQASAFDPLRRRTINNTEHKHRRQFTYRPSSRTGQIILVLRLIMFYMMVHDDSILLWLLVWFQFYLHLHKPDCIVLWVTVITDSSSDE